MESLLTSLTNQSIKDIERNDFRIEAYANKQDQYHLVNEHNELDDEDDEEEEVEEEDESSASDVSSTQSSKCISIANTLANLNLDDYDALKYTGNSAGLQLIDQSLFKSKPYVQLPGREDVALRLMPQNELLVVRTDCSGKKKSNTRLDVGFSLNSSIFDEKKSYKTNLLNLLQLICLLVQSLKKLTKCMYFSHIHLFLPLINKTRFETHDSKTSNILTHAVLAVAFRFASRHFPKLLGPKKSAMYAGAYFQKVMYHLRDSNHPRLRHVQAALLMTLYLDMDEEDVESMQWYTLGKAIRMAQDIGLHRSCSNWNLPPSEIETRHRVFYVCYVLDRLMGARAGKPLTILDRDFDTDMPVAHEVYDDNRIGPSVYHSFIALIKLSEILGRILKALYAPKSKHSNTNAGLDDPTILAVFDRRLKNWRATLDEPNHGASWSQAQKVNLLLFYHTAMLLLHRPFIEYSSTALVVQGSVDLDKLASESRQACENAASNISVIIRQKQSLMYDPDSYGPLCLPTCFVYAMFQSSLIHLAVAIKNRDSLRRLRLLQRSITLLKQHEQLASAQRAHNILLMLVKINKINVNNLLENDTTKEFSNLEEDSLLSNPASPIPTSNEIQLVKSTQLQDMLTEEDTMPKSSWHQRMMNTSIIGGITADLHQNIHENASSSQTLNQLLPYATQYQPPYIDYDNNTSLHNPKRPEVYQSHPVLYEDSARLHPIFQNEEHANNYRMSSSTGNSSSLLSHHQRTGLTPTGLLHFPNTSTDTTSAPYSAHYTSHATYPTGLTWSDWNVYVNNPSMSDHPS
ncbi:fungal-specific transcription factor domain-containing protein [Gilbertella persicaria]|uniref:fungal-specific transcription factor domain-containing protein n=1 Tax=Gilbertella persicaria TaxID=101096 RepID=UPI0022212165|nr:fungal-specific transcription factor domain-containing protein [Gilbertella persicaria]KAI8080732.1 fungal-specific transcription factor domain-containing protein [Gilbertella persicaria]